MNRRDFDIDHIDPVWESGRDYQLVCGFNCLANLREEDPSFNTSKSNRFLPWRWSRDEIGVVPQEPGDLAYFLVGADIEKDIPGEWVLMEFLSDEWMESSWETCSLCVNNRLMDWMKEKPEEYLESCRRGGLTAGKENYTYLERYYEENPEKKKEFALLGAAVTKKTFEENPGEALRRLRLGEEARKRWMKENPEKLRENCSAAGVASGKVRYRCAITGKISTAAGVVTWQKARGIPTTPENRIRIN
jgi:hypothetical protein